MPGPTTQIQTNNEGQVTLNQTHSTHRDTKLPVRARNDTLRYDVKQIRSDKEKHQQTAYMRSAFENWRTRFNKKQHTTSTIRRLIAYRQSTKNASIAFKGWKNWTSYRTSPPSEDREITTKNCMCRAALRVYRVLQMSMNRVTSLEDTAFNTWKKWVRRACKKKTKEFFRKTINDGITRTNKTLITRTMTG
jgi:hypothetical protein